MIGVDPNLGDYDNRTALHLAASNGHLETITRMLEFGYLDAQHKMTLKRLRLQALKQKTSKNTDAASKQLMIIRISRHQDLSPLDRFGQTPLDDAIRHEHVAVQKFPG